MLTIITKTLNSQIPETTTPANKQAFSQRQESQLESQLELRLESALTANACLY